LPKPFLHGGARQTGLKPVPHASDIVPSSLLAPTSATTLALTALSGSRCARHLQGRN